MCTCVISDWPSLKAYWGMKKKSSHTQCFLSGQSEEQQDWKQKWECVLKITAWNRQAIIFRSESTV